MLPAGPVPASSASAAHWRQKHFFHEWFKKYDPKPAAGGLTIVYRFFQFKGGISTLFAEYSGFHAKGAKRAKAERSAKDWRENVSPRW